MFIELIGAAAGIMLFTAYFFITTERWGRISLRYQGCTFVGSCLLVIYGIAKSAYANVALNAVWAVVGVYGLIVWYRRLRQAKTVVAKAVSTEEEDML
jgi:hypothetical protein